MIPKKQKEKALFLLNKGLDKRAIAELVACSLKTVSRWEKKQNEAHKPIDETLQALINEANKEASRKPFNSSRMRELSYSINTFTNLKIK